MQCIEYITFNRYSKHQMRFVKIYFVCCNQVRQLFSATLCQARCLSTLAATPSMQHCLKLCNKDCGLFKTQCSILTSVMYVHSPILGILRKTLLILTIPIKCDVLNVLHDGTGHAIIGK